MDVDTMPGAPLDCVTTLYEYGGAKDWTERMTMLSDFLLSTIERPLALLNLSWLALQTRQVTAGARRLTIRRRARRPS